jgi:hypothetical protein
LRTSIPHTDRLLAPWREGTKFRRPQALDDGERRMIADRYAKGATIVQLAEEYEVGVGTIWRALNRSA